MTMCNGCLSQWWQTQIKNQIYAGEASAPCPGKAISKCKLVYDEKWIKIMFDALPDQAVATHYYDVINIAMFERYLV